MSSALGVRRLAAALLLTAGCATGEPMEKRQQAAALQIELNPTTDVYPRYVADPRRSRHIMSIATATETEIPGAGDLRWAMSIGGEYPLIALTKDDPQRRWQASVEARVYMQFDIEHDLDELGHDGRLGLIVSKGLNDTVAARFVFHHTSSHVGDEYILRNNVTERLSVRKEELAGGISWLVSDAIRVYGEMGYGLNLGVRNEPLRIQGGVEYESQPLISIARWYAASDLALFEENDWEPSVNVQTGIVLPFPQRGRWVRVGLELYDGRSQLDSFFMYRERYVVFGAWLDL